MLFHASQGTHCPYKRCLQPIHMYRMPQLQHVTHLESLMLGRLLRPILQLFREFITVCAWSFNVSVKMSSPFHGHQLLPHHCHRLCLKKLFWLFRMMLKGCAIVQRARQGTKACVCTGLV